MRKGVRTFAKRSLGAVPLLAILLGAEAPAAQSGAPETVITGQAPVQAKDLARKTLTLEGRVLSVTPESELRNREGALIGLGDLRALSEQKAVGGMLVDVSGVDVVQYEARDVAGSLLLERLRVIEGPR